MTYSFRPALFTYLVAGTLILAVSCTVEEKPNTSPKIKEAANLEVSSPGVVKWGDTVWLELTDSLAEVSISKGAQSVPSQLVDGRIRILSEDLGLGEHTLTLRSGDRTGRTLVNVYSDLIAAYRDVKVLERFSQRPDLFTQGLEFDGPQLYLGTGSGNRTASEVMVFDRPGGTVLKNRELVPGFFGEGITIIGDELYQLTWQNHKCFVYDKTSLEPTRTMENPREGWGLTNDGTDLVMSDGSSVLSWHDPRTFQEKRRVTVCDHNGPVSQLNELERVDSLIYANQWQSDQILVIQMSTGKVLERLNCSPLKREVMDDPQSGSGLDVLNGIAHRKSDGALFVTGKNWPKLFRIEVMR